MDPNFERTTLFHYCISSCLTVSVVSEFSVCLCKAQKVGVANCNVVLLDYIMRISFRSPSGSSFRGQEPLCAPSSIRKRSDQTVLKYCVRDLKNKFFC